MKEQGAEMLNYVKLLKNSFNLNISFHLYKKYYPALYDISTSLHMHNSAYCLKMKQLSENQRKCLWCQTLVKKKCSQNPSFIGICYADVKEYIHGINHDGKCIGYICASGYRAENPHYIKDSQLNYLYNTSTSEEMPSEQFLKSAIAPLARMFEFYISTYDFPQDRTHNDYIKILNYINEHYTTVTRDELCEHFNFSASHISHIFKRYNGNSISQYANILKIRNAKNLMRSTSMPILDIALLVGFNDLSHFICTFKKQTGKTPSQYRKEHKEVNT